MSRLLVLCAVLFCTAAAEAGTRKLSLRDALSMALENNNRIKAANFNFRSRPSGNRKCQGPLFTDDLL